MLVAYCQMIVCEAWKKHSFFIGVLPGFWWTINFYRHDNWYYVTGILQIIASFPGVFSNLFLSMLQIKKLLRLSLMGKKIFIYLAKGPPWYYCIKRSETIFLFKNICYELLKIFKTTQHYHGNKKLLSKKFTGNLLFCMLL